MKIRVVGNSHLAHHTLVGAVKNGLEVVRDGPEDIVLIAHDTETDYAGKRNLKYIKELVESWCLVKSSVPVILMSQVPPGFCRRMNKPNLYYYPETLRIRDAYERACKPEYIAIGCAKTYDVDTDSGGLVEEVRQFAKAFGCPVYAMTYEEAEFSKIAVNMMLASQVDTVNRLAKAAEKCGAKWENICKALNSDSRIGKYLAPGRWEDSIHLLRDYVTLKEIEDART